MLYDDSQIILFDEATSSLDGFTEKKIMQSLDNLLKLKTIIVIAHRLKTIENCDVIYFMKDGKIIDQGNYQTLFDNNPEFRELTKYA